MIRLESIESNPMPVSLIASKAGLDPEAAARVKPTVRDMAGSPDRVQEARLTADAIGGR